MSRKSAPKASLRVISSPPPGEDKYFILSIKWSRESILTWWRPDAMGYTMSLDDAGVYTAEYALLHNDLIDCAAIPVSVARSMQFPAVSEGRKSDLIAVAGKLRLRRPVQGPGGGGS